MGSRMKDVQRKLDLSLEDLVEESKTNGGTGGRGSGRKRRRVQSDDKGDTEKDKDDERQDPPAENGKREKKRDNEEKPEKPEKARRDSHVPRRTEVDLAEASGARKTGRPPASSSTAPVAHRPPMPGYPIPAWPQTFDPRIAYPAYRPPPPMYLRQPPVFRPAPVPYMMPPAYPHPAPAPAPAPLRIAGPPPHPPHYPPVAAAPGHAAAPPAVAPSQPSQPSRKRHRERLGPPSQLTDIWGPWGIQTGGAMTDWQKLPPYGGDSADFKVKYSAQCFCKRVRFDVSVDPMTAKLCDCSVCQRLHGAPVQWAALFQKNQVRFETSSLSFLRWYHTATDAVCSNGTERLLPSKLQCTHCGTWVADEG
eukprot:symbB.v1.2.017607.t1/scaffold1376.1/size122662/7